MTAANRARRYIRGIRTSISGGTMLGRLSPGEGRPEMLDVDDVLTHLALNNEDIEDLVGAMFIDTGTIDFTYDDGAGTIVADFIGDLDDVADVDVATPNDGEVLTWVAANNAWEAVAAAGGGGGGGAAISALHVQDQKSTGTEGGAASATTVHTRVLNTVVTNSITGASLSSNQITLAAGTYEIWASCPGHDIGRHRAIWYNVTDAAIELLGPNAFIGTGDNSETHAIIESRFTIAGTKTFELRHYGQSAKATLGLGVAVSDGNVEVYANVFILKIESASIDLDDLSDVNAGAPTDTYVLTWDSGTSKWIAAASAGGGASALDDLTDVVITAVADQNHLVYDSGTAKWINETPNRRIDGGEGVGDTATALFTIDGGTA